MVWSPDLQLAYQDVERALTRGIGDAVKAEEVKLAWWDEWWRMDLSAFEHELPSQLPKLMEGRPAGGIFLWTFGSCFALREVELGCLTLAEDCVELNFDVNVVMVNLTAS